MEILQTVSFYVIVAAFIVWQIMSNRTDALVRKRLDLLQEAQQGFAESIVLQQQMITLIRERIELHEKALKLYKMVPK